MMYPSLPLAEAALPAWRALLALLLAGVLTAGVLLSLWFSGVQARMRLVIMLVLLALLLTLLATVWLVRRALPPVEVQAEPATTEVWLVHNIAVPGQNRGGLED